MDQCFLPLLYRDGYLGIIYICGLILHLYTTELDNIFINEFPIISIKNNVGKELRNEIDNVKIVILGI